MKHYIRLAHRWLGYPLGLIFLLTLLTGIVTGTEDYLQSLRNYRQNYVPLSEHELALSIGYLHQQHQGYRQIQLPTPDSPVFMVSMRGEKWVYTPQTLELLTRIDSTQNAIFSYILRLHRNLALGKAGLMGASGNKWVAWIGLLSAGISLLGLYLWWPLRKSFRFSKLVPQNNRHASFFMSHFSGGVVCLVFLLLFAVTGAAIAYRPVAQSLLLANPLKQSASAENQPAAIYTGKPWYFAVAYLQDNHPDALLRSIAPARRGGTTPDWARGSIELRYTSGYDWLGLAGSRIYVHPDTGAILGQSQFADFTLGEKLYRMILPLHTGRGVTKHYLLIMLIMMTLLFVSVLCGLTSFIKRKSKLDKNIVKKNPSLKGWLS